MPSTRSAPPTPPPRLLLGFALALVAGLAACDRVEVDPAVAEGPMARPGEPVDTALAAQGAVLFQKQCVACHTLDGSTVVGPSLRDVTERRSYAWIRGMVMAPDSMLRVDPDARALLERYRIPMIDTGLDEARFRAVLEFLRGVAARDTVTGSSGPAP